MGIIVISRHDGIRRYLSDLGGEGEDLVGLVLDTCATTPMARPHPQFHHSTTTTTGSRPCLMHVCLSVGRPVGRCPYLPCSLRGRMVRMEGSDVMRLMKRVYRNSTRST